MRTFTPAIAALALVVAGCTAPVQESADITASSDRPPVELLGDCAMNEIDGCAAPAPVPNRSKAVSNATGKSFFRAFLRLF